ncbi:MAG TPA: hypothetical protein VGB33_00700 [Acidimicrobiia bacterium]|jgi:hypothetical protein
MTVAVVVARSTSSGPTGLGGRAANFATCDLEHLSIYNAGRFDGLGAPVFCNRAINARLGIRADR